jgi:hypothetical protein
MTGGLNVDGEMVVIFDILGRPSRVTFFFGFPDPSPSLFLFLLLDSPMFL